MKKILLSVLFIFVVIASCKKDDDDPKKDVSLKVIVKSAVSNAGIKAYIFLGDSLYGTTNTNGEFSAPTVKTGKYEFTVSAPYFRDTTYQLNLSSNVNLNFSLTIDSTMGELYGEFEDMTLWRQELKKTADLASWSENKVWQITTGATILYKNFDYELPNRYVLLGNDTIAQTDGFGQYFIKLQCGTYKLTGSCGGYSNASGVIKVKQTVNSTDMNFLNFYLERK